MPSRVGRCAVGAVFVALAMGVTAFPGGSYSLVRGGCEQHIVMAGSQSSMSKNGAACTSGGSTQSMAWRQLQSLLRYQIQHAATSDAQKFPQFQELDQASAVCTERAQDSVGLTCGGSSSGRKMYTWINDPSNGYVQSKAPGLPGGRGTVMMHVHSLPNGYNALGRSSQSNVLLLPSGGCWYRQGGSAPSPSQSSQPSASSSGSPSASASGSPSASSSGSPSASASASPAAQPSNSPAPKPSASSKPKPSSSSKPKPSASAKPLPSSSPKPKPSATPKPSASSKAKPSASSKAKASPSPSASASASASAKAKAKAAEEKAAKSGKSSTSKKVDPSTSSSASASASASPSSSASPSASGPSDDPSNSAGGTLGVDGPMESTSPIPGDEDGQCFPGSAVVELANGETKTMAALQVGDRVRVSETEFSDVFMFTHRLSEVTSDFVVLTTDSGKKLSVTSGHYIYANGVMTAAGKVVVGDALELSSGAATTVTAVAVQNLQGLYNPQTMHGDVVVDGLRASTYTTAVEPAVAHGVLSPLRALFRWTGLYTTSLDSGNAAAAAAAPSGPGVCAN